MRTAGRRALQAAKDKGATAEDLALNLSKEDLKELHVACKKAAAVNKALKQISEETAAPEEGRARIEAELLGKADAKAKLQVDFQELQSKLEQFRARPPVETKMDIFSLLAGTRQLVYEADVNLSKEGAEEFKDIFNSFQAFVQKTGGFVADRLNENLSVDHEMANDEYEDSDLAAAAAEAAKAADGAAEGANVEQVKLQAYAVELRKHKRARVIATVLKRRSGG